MTKKTEESQEFNDDFIRNIVKKSERSFPNPDFEDQMMLRIQNELEYKKEVAAQLRISLKFFQGALIAALGLTLFYLFSDVFMDYSNKTIAVLGLFFIALIGILNFDNYRRLIKMYL